MRTRALSLLVVSLGLSASLVAQASELCVVVGSVAYERFASAQTLKDKAMALGFPNAAIYDTRDVPEFAWGQLAVVAAVVTGKEAVAPVVKTLKAGKLKAFAKPCTLPAKKVTSAAELVRPAEELLPYELDVEGLEPGCHAYSPVLKAAFCIDGVTSWNDITWTATFPGAEIASFELQTIREDAEEAKIDPEGAGARALEKVLAAGKFVVMPEGRSMDAAAWLSWAENRLTIRASTKLTGPPGENQAPRYTHSLTFRCGKEPMAPAGEVSDVTDDTPQITVTRLPRSPTVLIEVHFTIADEGEYGKGVDVIALTLPPACMGAPAP